MLRSNQLSYVALDGAHYSLISKICQAYYAKNVKKQRITSKKLVLGADWVIYKDLAAHTDHREKLS